MSRIPIETKMEILHELMNKHEQVKGTILLRENGLHLSSIVPQDMPGNRRLSAGIAEVFRHLYKPNGLDEGYFQLKNESAFYMKQIPSKKAILTIMTDKVNSPNLVGLIAQFSRMFQNIL